MKLLEYVRTRLSYDSFGVATDCPDGRTPVTPDRLLQVENNGQNTHSVSLSPFVGLPQVLKSLLASLLMTNF